MTRKRRVFNDEFKQQAVRRARERRAVGIPLTQIGREVGVRTELLRRWVRLAKEREDPAASGSGGEEIVTLAELKRLRRENDTLRQERDFAKKAAAFFARELR